jgi:hypothetical protein
MQGAGFPVIATALEDGRYVVGCIGWFAASVAGWVVCKQCLSVASICQVIGCVLSGHWLVISLRLYANVMLVRLLDGHFSELVRL